MLILNRFSDHPETFSKLKIHDWETFKQNLHLFSEIAFPQHLGQIFPIPILKIVPFQDVFK